ncbi:MAG: glycine zipper domain-containing protein [Gemmataceae bacterium]
MIAKRSPGRVRRCLVAGLLATVTAGGCQSMNNTDRGVLTGGALGAIGGAAIGSMAGRPGAGAAIGAGLGAVAGGANGAAIDNAERRMQAREQAVAARQQLALQDVVALTASGSSDDVIVTQIRQSGSVYRLSAQDIVWLQNQGVREPVIREMQATAYRPVRHVYTAVPVAPVYVVPPPPVGVGVGVTFRGR